MIEKGLKLLCQGFACSGGVVYEIDQHNNFILQERWSTRNIAWPASFAADSIAADYRRQLAQQTVVCLNSSRQNSPPEAELLAFFGVASLALVALVDENTRINGFIMLYTQTEIPLLSAADRQTLTVTLMMLAGYVGQRVYQNKLVFAKNALASILDNVGIDIYVCDFYTHEILYINKSMTATYSDRTQFLGRKCWEVLFPGATGVCSFCPQPKLIDERGEPTKVYSWENQRPSDGAWFRVFSSAFRWLDGRLAHVVSCADITANKRNEALIETMANYDSLTRLPNRRMMVRDCERRLSQTREGDVGHVLFFDIDGFKAINDTWGHSAGDEFLVQLGQFFDGLALLKGAIYRSGGDEFIGLIDNHKTEADVRELAALIHRRFEQPWHLQAGDIFCSVSIGVARYPEDGKTPEELLNKADKAMYKVKKAAGKGGVMFGYEL